MTAEEKRRWRNYLAQRRRDREVRRSVPSIKSVEHRLLIEAQVPGLTVNEDGDFSSPGLTAWYVDEFCRISNLKR